jgi:hypothetical protein
MNFRLNGRCFWFCVTKLRLIQGELPRVGYQKERKPAEYDSQAPEDVEAQKRPGDIFNAKCVCVGRSSLSNGRIACEFVLHGCSGSKPAKVGSGLGLAMLQSDAWLDKLRKRKRS